MVGWGGGASPGRVNRRERELKERSSQSAEKIMQGL